MQHQILNEAHDENIQVIALQLSRTLSFSLISLNLERLLNHKGICRENNLDSVDSEPWVS